MKKQQPQNSAPAVSLLRLLAFIKNIASDLRSEETIIEKMTSGLVPDKFNMGTNVSGQNNADGMICCSRRYQIASRFLTFKRYE